MNAYLSKPGTLLAAAAVCVLVLTMLSDFQPPEAAGLADLEDEATLTVMVLGCRECAGGYLLQLSDGAGGEATAFCPADLLAAPLTGGEAVTVTMRPSADDPDFLFVSEISRP